VEIDWTEVGDDVDMDMVCYCSAASSCASHNKLYKLSSINSRLASWLMMRFFVSRREYALYSIDPCVVTEVMRDKSNSPIHIFM